MSLVRRLNFFAVVLGACFFPCSAFAADWEGIFEGTLGGKPIFVQLNAVNPIGQNAFSRYSYASQASDLFLVPDGNDDGHRFVEATDFSWSRAGAMEAKNITGHWRIDVNGDGATGTWHSNKGGDADLPITLKRLALLQKPVAESQNILSESYEDVVIRKTAVFGPPHKPVSFGPVTVAYVADKTFGMAFPRLVKHPDKAVLEKANAALMELHLNSLIDYRSCADGDIGQKQNGPDAVAEYYFEVEYASPQLISFTQHGTNHCGGAHYNQFVSAKTLDLHTMKTMEDEDVEALSKGMGQIFKLDSKDERIAFEKLWVDAWSKTARKLGEDASECGAPEAITGDETANFYFTRKGLAVLVNDSGYFDAAGCWGSGSTPAIIPWPKLKPFLKTGQTLLQAEMR